MKKTGIIGCAIYKIKRCKNNTKKVTYGVSKNLLRQHSNISCYHLKIATFSSFI